MSTLKGEKQDFLLLCLRWPHSETSAIKARESQAKGPTGPMKEQRRRKPTGGEVAALGGDYRSGIRPLRRAWSFPQSSDTITPAVNHCWAEAGGQTHLRGGLVETLRLGGTCPCLSVRVCMCVREGAHVLSVCSAYSIV